MTATAHPGDVTFASLSEDLQTEIARGWGEYLTPEDVGHYFDRYTPDEKWEILCTLPGRDGQHAAEVQRIAENVDPATQRAFDALPPPHDDSSAPPPPENSSAPPHDLFRTYAMPELLAKPDGFAWLIRRLLADPTYGQIAGGMKTLKSYLQTFIVVGLCAGVPILGHFDPVTARPALVYVGEGGEVPWTRRLRRICKAMDVDPNDLDLHASHDVAPIDSMVFQESLRRDLDQIKPGLFCLDPFYAYHGVATRAADLHQEGALLNLVSRPCIDAGASLLMVNHFNQTGNGSSLKRITMAGSGEWADSWLLLEHREPPDVENGLFRLTLDVGSRQWGGTTWNLDLDIGRFDVDTGSHDGQITWDLCRGTGAKAERSASADRASKRITDTLADHPWEMTKTEVRTAVGGNRDAFDRAFDALAEADVIVHDKRGRTESGTTKTRLLWGTRPVAAEPDGPGWAGDDA